MAVNIDAEYSDAFDAVREIARFKNGENSSGDVLVGQIHRIVKRRLKRLSATDQECDELSQECAIGILQRLHEYRSELGTFEGWVSGFAHNSWRSYLRSVARQRRSVVSIDELSSAQYEFGSSVNQRDNLAQALDSLELVDRELLHMKFSLGMTSDEIAHASDMNAPQVRKRISRAVERLRKHPATQSLLLSLSAL